MNTGNCTQTPKCNLASDQCVQRSCTNGVCSVVNTTCKTTDQCNPTTGCDPNKGCQYKAVNCDDKNNCTVDSCSNGTCSNIPVVCTAPNPCTVAACNPLSGTCLYTPKVCTAPNNCTSTSCNMTTGNCDIVTLNATQICDDGNLCTIDTCSTVGGGQCVHTPIVCPKPNDTCTTYQCSPGYGCISTFIICVLDENGNSVVQQSNVTYPPPKDCSIAYCQNGTCTKDVQACAGLIDVNTAVIVGSTLGGVAIAGICIAGVVGLGAIGAGGGYAIITGAGAGGVSSTTNNPLYQESGVKAVNPLYQA